MVKQHMEKTHLSKCLYDHFADTLSVSRKDSFIPKDFDQALRAYIKGRYQALIMREQYSAVSIVNSIRIDSSQERKHYPNEHVLALKINSGLRAYEQH